MEQIGRILLADDEATFLESTADLLRRSGYHCDCATSGEAAGEMLRAGEYDLLLADIRMPGNPELQLVRGVAQAEHSVPVVLVTGYPSLRSAVDALDLPVVGYLTKPVELDEMLSVVQRGVARSRIQKLIRSQGSRLDGWRQGVDLLETSLATHDRTVNTATLDAFVELTFRNLLDCLSDLKGIFEAAVLQKGGDFACHTLNCPRHAAMLDVVNDAVRTLEGTKRSFRSKELGDLRHRLEAFLESEKGQLGSAELS